MPYWHISLTIGNKNIILISSIETLERAGVILSLDQIIDL